MGAIFGTDDVSGLINEVGGEVIISANTTVDGDLTSTSYTASAQSGFSAYRADAQAIANSSAVTVAFTTEVYDTLGEYVDSTGIFTATVAGTYQVNWGVQLTAAAWAAGEYFYASLYKNDSSDAGNLYRGMFTYESYGSTLAKVSTGSTLIQLSIGDTLRVKAVHNQGASVNTAASGAYNYFNVQKVA